jgi:hypothetical protein
MSINNLIKIFKRIEKSILPIDHHKNIIDSWDGTDNDNDRAPFSMRISKLLLFLKITK